MIKNIYVFNNFNIACTDESGHQVAKEQGNMLIDVLRGMLKRKVVTAETLVYLTDTGAVTIGEYLGIKKK
jgi:hypothetical protein